MKLGLFLEDQGHENLLCELVSRVAAAEGVVAEISVRNAVGGSGQVLTSLRRYLRDLARRTVAFTDVLVVAIDGNCQGANARRKEIRDIAAQATFGGHLVCAVPDPHIEVWYLADGIAVASVVGGPAEQPALPAAKCERGLYKLTFVPCLNPVV